MPCPTKRKKVKGHRKHTPITSEVQRGAMGVALAKKRGKKVALRGPARAIAKGMTKTELARHLRESGGKKLPKKRRRP